VDVYHVLTASVTLLHRAYTTVGYDIRYSLSLNNKESEGLCIMKWRIVEYLMQHETWQTSFLQVSPLWTDFSGNALTILCIIS